MKNSVTPTDKIRIEGLKLETIIGVPDDERASGPQTVTVHVEIMPKTAFSESGDDIDLTVDYFEVAEALKRTAGKGERKLIETLAMDLADTVLTFKQAAHVRVEVRKFILPDTDFVAVTTEKSA